MRSDSAAKVSGSRKCRCARTVSRSPMRTETGRSEASASQVRGLSPPMEVSARTTPSAGHLGDAPGRRHDPITASQKGEMRSPRRPHGTSGCGLSLTEGAWEALASPGPAKLWTKVSRWSLWTPNGDTSAWWAPHGGTVSTRCSLGRACPALCSDATWCCMLANHGKSPAVVVMPSHA